QTPEPEISALEINPDYKTPPPNKTSKTSQSTPEKKRTRELLDDAQSKIRRMHEQLDQHFGFK
ncbi:MAG: hypothetical protein ACD_29C00309G0001, partial [uncultured bacterium]